jgi:hypothetical protein
VRARCTEWDREIEIHTERQIYVDKERQGRFLKRKREE